MQISSSEEELEEEEEEKLSVNSAYLKNLDNDSGDGRSSKGKEIKNPSKINKMDTVKLDNQNTIKLNQLTRSRTLTDETFNLAKVDNVKK